MILIVDTMTEELVLLPVSKQYAGNVDYGTAMLEVSQRACY